MKTARKINFNLMKSLPVLFNYLNNTIEHYRKKILLTSKPISLEIESTTRCNLKCIMCPWDFDSVDKDFPENFILLLRNFIKSSLRISLHVLGEPLMSKKLDRIFNEIPYITDIYFSTNAQPLDDKHIELFSQRKLLILNISLDSPDKDRYRIIRGGSLDKAILNIKRLKKLSNVRLLLNMTLMKLNIDDIDNFCSFAKSLDIKRIVFYKLAENFDFIREKNGYHFAYKEQILGTADWIKAEQQIEKRKDEFDRIMILGRTAFRKIKKISLLRKIKNFIKEPKILFLIREVAMLNTKLKKRNKMFCSLPWENLLVKINGEVRFCCWQKPIGNLMEDSINDIWNGENARSIRSSIKNGCMSVLCKDKNCDHLK